MDLNEKLKEYQKKSKRTLPDLEQSDNLKHMSYGIITEYGEIFDIFKKHIFYGKELDLKHLSEEIGDCMFYLINIFNILESDFKNIEFKLEEVDRDKFLKNFDPFALAATLGEFNVYSHINTLYNISNIFELDFQEILSNNIEKLEKRYPEKFTEKDAIERKDKNG